MILLPVYFVCFLTTLDALESSVVKKAKEENLIAGEALRRDLKKMGMYDVRGWQGWILAQGELTVAGAERLGCPQAKRKKVMLATQPVSGGWVMGILNVEGERARSYIQGPGAVKEGLRVPYAVAVDGGSFFNNNGWGLPDGTVSFTGFAAGRRAVFRFGPRKVEFDVRKFSEVWAAVMEFRMLEEAPAPKVPDAKPLPPPTIKLK